MHSSKNFVLSEKATHSHNPIASHSMSVITYCHQKNLLRVRTKPHIRLCKDWSSQRFKSLPSILCKIVVVQSRLPNKRRSFYQNHRFDRRFEPSPGVERAAALRLLLVLFVEAKRINSFPFGNFLTSKKLAPVGAARCACKGASRFCKPRSRSHRWRYHKGRFAAFHLLLKK